MKVVLENLTKIFDRQRGQRPVTAVDDFNFEIPDGKLVALLGPSGCGKSTTLNLICGLESPTSGHIWFDDVDMTDVPPEHRGVGMVFQNYALYPHMTVEQNIRFPLENVKKDRRLSRETMKEKVLEAARLVQIEEQLDRKPSQLSGGQQQRVAIARALVRMPSVLLLDEPLSNLDARLRLQTREEIRRIQKETGITTVFVTHDQDEAMSISDLIIVMNAGKLQQIGRPQDVYDDPVNLFVARFLGTPQINVFRGRIRGTGVYIGDEAVGSIASDTEEKDAYVCIRPEGFIPDEDGPLSCTLQRVEVMGRDTSLLCSHAGCEAPVMRSIIPAAAADAKQGDRIRFTVRPEKLLVFDRQTQERIR